MFLRSFVKNNLLFRIMDLLKRKSPLFPVVRSIPLSSSKIILNTEAKLAVTKSVKIFIFGKIKLKLKIISYFLILQYFNVCFIFINCIS